MHWHIFSSILVNILWFHILTNRTRLKVSYSVSESTQKEMRTAEIPMTLSPAFTEERRTRLFFSLLLFITLEIVKFTAWIFQCEKKSVNLFVSPVFFLFYFIFIVAL